jgi:cytochrome P450
MPSDDLGRFDPNGFTGAAQPGRHRSALVTFGGGAHMCLGLNFTHMQAKCFVRHLVQNLAVSVARGYSAAWRMWPTPRPKDGLPAIVGPVQSVIARWLRSSARNW